MDRKKKKDAIKKIENEQERLAEFERRRKELQEEACALSSDTGAEIDLVGFTPDGKTFNFGSTSDGKMYDRFISEEKVNEMIAANENRAMIPEVESESESEEEESDGFWWNNIDISKLDTVEEVEALKKALLEVKKKVSERKQKLVSGAAAGSSGQRQ
ncbi:hypothetical protein MKW92_029646 [Papaver armeniacum]|nr:hypothetical protein MKW92_029646 [Papaver armeniacum]